jgi:predicted transcriptional regulator
VITIDAKDTFEKLLVMIQTHGFTHYPIFEEGTCLGVFTDSGIAHALAHTPVDRISTLYQSSIKSLIDYDEHVNDVLIVLQKDSIFDIFDALMHHQKEIETVLIVTQVPLTHNNQIKGLLVAKALPKILEKYIIGPQ